MCGSIYFIGDTIFLCRWLRGGEPLVEYTQPAQEGRDVWLLQSSLVLHALLFPDMPAWMSSVPPAQAPQALCEEKKQSWKCL